MSICSEQRWAEFLEKLQVFSFFHTPDWYRACGRLPGGKKTWGALLFQTPEGEFLFPYLVSQRGPLRFLYSGPRGGYGGFIGESPPSPNLVSQLLHAAQKATRTRWIYLVLPPNTLPPRLPGFHALKQETHRLPLQDTSLERLSHPTRRKQVRRCRERERLQVAQGKAYLPDLLRLYQAYPWSERTPLTFLQTLAESGRTRLFALLLEEQVIQAALVLEGKGEVSSYLYVRKRGDPRIPNCASAFFTAEILHLYRSQGIETFDFGASPNRGVRAFKESFGARSAPVYHLTNIPRPLLRLIVR